MSNADTLTNMLRTRMQNLHLLTGSGAARERVALAQALCEDALRRLTCDPRRR